MAFLKRSTRLLSMKFCLCLTECGGFGVLEKGGILPRKSQSATGPFFACLPFMKQKDRHDLVQISQSAGQPKSIGEALAMTLWDAQIHGR